MTEPTPTAGKLAETIMTLIEPVRDRDYRIGIIQAAIKDALAAAEKRGAAREREKWRTIVEDLLRYGFSDQEARLSIAGFGGTRQSAPELHERCDRLGDAQERARKALRANVAD